MASISTRIRNRADNPVLFAPPDIDDDDIQAVVEVLRSKWITTGPKVKEFERLVAQQCGVKHAVAVNSATAALHLALDAIGLKPGDEVIVPTTTFTATAEVVRYFDATPILVDIDPDTFCIDPARIAQAISPKTKAIIPVHFGGHAAEMDEITALARDNNLKVIGDAAHGFPGSYKGRPIGALGDVSALSFYATKTITTGEGGMLLTNDDAFEERARIMSLHGMSRDAWKRYSGAGSWRYDVVAPGFKYNLTDMAASLGIAQLSKAERMLRRREVIAQTYSQALREYPELQPPTSKPQVKHSWHLYVLRLNLERLSLSRDEFLAELTRRGIGTSVHFIPLHMFTYYKETYDLVDSSFPVASREFERSLSLPIYSAMSDDDIEDTIANVTRIVERSRV